MSFINYEVQIIKGVWLIITIKQLPKTDENFGGKWLFSMVMFEVCPRITDGLWKAAK